MRVIYPYGPSDTIISSIRSVSTHCPEAKILLVGESDPPDWYCGDYLKVPGPHVWNKLLRINRAMQYLVHQIDEPFLVMNDDQILLDRIDPELVSGKLYLESEILESPTGADGSFMSLLTQTIWCLQQDGYSGYNYCIHAPYMVDPKLARKALELYGVGFHFETIYFNLFGPENPTPVSEVPEYLRYMAHHSDSVKTVLNKCRGKGVLSFSDSGCTSSVLTALTLLYPNPCKWEK